jgi:hypothetical protein
MVIILSFYHFFLGDPIVRQFAGFHIDIFVIRRSDSAGFIIYDEIYGIVMIFLGLSSTGKVPGNGG